MQLAAKTGGKVIAALCLGSSISEDVARTDHSIINVLDNSCKASCRT